MLKEYKKKRDFTRTKEPAPKERPGKGPLSFVVQKHAARALHYDFRLELDGVLKSWAVPKGPSLDPKEKRLAVMVEDHPLDYASFEGSIPEGEYGAGQVIVWDKGVYSPDEAGGLFENRHKAEEIMRQNLEQGKLKIFLRGERLKGSWALVKMANRDKQWLLIKHSDQFASTSDVLKEGDSVASGLSLEEIKKGTKKTEKPSPVEPKEIRRTEKSSPLKLKEIKGAEKAAFPGVFSPMLATLGKKPFSDPDWIFEPKLDGYRVLAFIKKGKAKLISRNGIEVSDQYPAIMSDLDKLPPKDYVLDGEVVALDRSGRPRFQYLQNRLNLKSTGDSEFQIVYYIFDLLYLDGYDLRSVALSRRKEVLAKAVAPSGHVRLIEYLEKEGESLYEASIKIGLEGVVAKRNDSLYEVGRRSNNWVKIKSVLSDEFIIGGYTQGTGNRIKTFGSLLLGSYDKNKKLIFVGHVGTGYDTQLLAGLKKRLDALRSSRNPFSENPPLNGQTTWVKPELAAEVKFAERTQEGILRAPVFLRLREDKPLSEMRVAESAAVSTDNLEGESALNKKSPPKKGARP